MSLDKIISLSEKSVNFTNRLLGRISYISEYKKLHSKKIESVIFLFTTLSISITYFFISLNENNLFFKSFFTFTSLTLLTLSIPVLGATILLFKYKGCKNIKNYKYKTLNKKIIYEELPSLLFKIDSNKKKHFTKTKDILLSKSFKELILDINKREFFDSEKKCFKLDKYGIEPLQSFQILLLYFGKEYNLNQNTTKQHIYDLFNDYFNLEGKTMTSKNWKNYSELIELEDDNNKKHIGKYKFYNDLLKLK